MPGMRIGTLAHAAGCTVETVRFYERAGLLPAPPRSEGNYRLYEGADLDRLRFIRRCRALDMTHDEVRALLAFKDAPDRRCTEVNALLEEHIGHVAARIDELESLAADLRRLRSRCKTSRSVADCGIIRALGKDSVSTKVAERGHVSRTHR